VPRIFGCYVNLVTSGLGLTEDRLADLVDRGLAHVQLSMRAADAAVRTLSPARRRTSASSPIAELVKAHDLPLSVNVVLHKANHDQVGPADGAGGADERRPAGAGEHPVLQLGAARPDRAHADPRPARGGGTGCADPATGECWSTPRACAPGRPVSTSSSPGADRVLLDGTFFSPEEMARHRLERGSTTGDGPRVDRRRGRQPRPPQAARPGGCTPPEHEPALDRDSAQYAAVRAAGADVPLDNTELTL
jgi:hypothetical protein